MRRIAIGAALGMLALAGCGDDGDSGAETTAAAAELVVTVRPEGADGPARKRTVRCGELSDGTALCGALRTLDLAQVPSTTACTQVFGGPATASVHGTLRGKELHARFDLSNGCEIERWRRNAALLGDPPGNPPRG